MSILTLLTLLTLLTVSEVTVLTFLILHGSVSYAVTSLTLDHQNPNIGIPKGEASLFGLTKQVRVPRNAKSLPREGILSKIQDSKLL